MQGRGGPQFFLPVGRMKVVKGVDKAKKRAQAESKGEDGEGLRLRSTSVTLLSQRESAQDERAQIN